MSFCFPKIIFHIEVHLFSIGRQKNLDLRHEIETILKTSLLLRRIRIQPRLPWASFNCQPIIPCLKMSLFCLPQGSVPVTPGQSNLTVHQLRSAMGKPAPTTPTPESLQTCLMACPQPSWVTAMDLHWPSKCFGFALLVGLYQWP